MAQNHTSPVTGVTIQASILVPARNEEASLERCLRSLVAQQGVAYELIVIDDGSTDRTAEIVERFSGVSECPFVGANPYLVRVRGLKASAFERGWIGKSNALWQAVQQAKGEWLLFTDADSVHEPGSLARAIDEAKRNGAVMLSYSPKQELHSVGERALMPLVFAELAARFRPAEVRDPTSPTAAANGQYILIQREAYFAAGGHEAVGGELLEDVALAKRVKSAGGKIQFRFGGDQVRARMYRSWKQMVEGWTKNLVLLFPDARTLAWRRLSEFTLLILSALVALIAALDGHFVLALAGLIIWTATAVSFGVRVTRSHAGLVNEVVSVAGLPIFSWLLLRSAAAHSRGEVIWKGRVYSASESAGRAGASVQGDQSSDGTGNAVPVVTNSSERENDDLPHQKV